MLPPCFRHIGRVHAFCWRARFVLGAEAKACAHCESVVQARDRPRRTDGSTMADRLMELSRELNKLKVTQLKERLRALQLPLSGRKAELVTRLAQATIDAEGGEDDAQPKDDSDNEGEEDSDNEDSSTGSSAAPAQQQNQQSEQQTPSPAPAATTTDATKSDPPPISVAEARAQAQQHKQQLLQAAQPMQKAAAEFSAPITSTPVVNLEDLVDETTDMIYEEEISRNKYNMSAWWRYIKAVTSRKAPSAVRNRVFERALRCLPGSYKIWHAYLMDCKQQVKGKNKTSPRYTVVNNTFERALVFMHKYPRIWLEYCAFLMKQPLITKTRRTFDRALQALPIMQHSRVWKLYMEFVRSPGMPRATATRLYKRFLQFDPSQREEYVEFLLLPTVRDYGEASAQLALIVSDDEFVSKKGKTTHRLWMDLCDLITKHPAEASARVNIEAIIRSGIRRFTDEVGRLWCALAHHYIRLANFEKARDVYEEGIDTVHTVRDFSMIFGTCCPVRTWSRTRCPSQLAYIDMLCAQTLTLASRKLW